MVSGPFAHKVAFEKVMNVPQSLWASPSVVLSWYQRNLLLNLTYLYCTCNISTVFICVQYPVAVYSCFAECNRFFRNKVCVPFAALLHGGSNIVSWAPAGILLNCSNSFVLEKEIKFSISAQSQIFNKTE